MEVITFVIGIIIGFLLKKEPTIKIKQITDIEYTNIDERTPEQYLDEYNHTVAAMKQADALLKEYGERG